MWSPDELRAARPWAGMGALALTFTAAAGAPLAVGAGAPGALSASLTHDHLAYGQTVVVSGRLASGQPGQRLAVEFHRYGAQWSVLARTVTRAGGRYRVATRLTESGGVRVVSGAPAAIRTVGASVAAVPALAQSPDHGVAVAASLTAYHQRLDVLAGHGAQVSGTLRPGRLGRRVTLQVSRRGRWLTVALTRTSRQGRFRLRYTPRRTGSLNTRLRFSGDQLNAGSTRSAGRLNSYRLAGASWYGPGGGLACGGQLTDATLGVANKTLPCGTRVTLRYRGRSVRVRVIDRGPYVAGRDYDLTPATKRALRFPDTGSVWATG